MEIEYDFEKRYRLVREIIETIVLTILMFLVIRLAVQNFNIEGFSMEPSLHDKELIIVDKWSYKLHPPARGDVIVFVAPDAPSQDYIKRIIGLPGDVISIRNNVVFVNNMPLKEFYVSPLNLGDYSGKVFENMLIPKDTYFVLGDNRKGSSDSRYWGCLPTPNIVGRAAVVYWPLGQDNNWLLPDASHVFQDVPATSPIASTSVCPLIGPPHPAAAVPGPLDSGVETLFVIAMPACFVTWRRRATKQVAGV